MTTVNEETCSARYKGICRLIGVWTLVGLAAMGGITSITLAANSRSLVVKAKQEGMSARLERIENKIDKLLNGK